MDAFDSIAFDSKAFATGGETPPTPPPAQVKLPRRGSGNRGRGRRG